MTKTELKRVCVNLDKKFEVIQDYEFIFQITKALYHKVLKLMERVSTPFLVFVSTF